MKMRFSTLLALFAVAAVAGNAVANVCESATYGAGVRLAETTSVSSILDAPESFVGKEVRVEGRVKEVCEMAGCWLEIEAGDPSADGRVLKVKVRDGEIEFPMSSRGKQAIAQGKVERLEMTRPKYLKYLKHIAAEQGKELEEASIVGEGPFHLYQIAGTGAEICR